MRCYWFLKPLTVCTALNVTFQHQLTSRVPQHHVLAVNNLFDGYGVTSYSQSMLVLVLTQEQSSSLWPSCLYTHLDNKQHTPIQVPLKSAITKHTVLFFTAQSTFYLQWRHMKCSITACQRWSGCQIDISVIDCIWSKQIKCLRLREHII